MGGIRDVVRILASVLREDGGEMTLDEYLLLPEPDAQEETDESTLDRQAEAEAARELEEVTG
jgi:hypothetical protein